MVVIAADRSSFLPWPRTTLVGRAHEVATARALLVVDSVPLLTLTGPGGVGKTRLAFAIAEALLADFADGVVFVDLSPIRDPTLVLPEIALAVGVREAGILPLADVLTGYLRTRQLLLVLDNCEQVLPAAGQVADLLTSAPALQVLATSRAPLDIRAEHLLAVPPLALPAEGGMLDTAELAQVEAVAFFVARARAADAGFSLTDQNATAVADICRRVDGLPLALELAAARSRFLSPPALLALLSHRLRLLTGGPRDAPARQRTLRDTIAWSYDLLEAETQRLFARLAVFTGGFDLEAAAAVAGEDEPTVLDRLGALVDQSLVRREMRPDGVRFGMLETVREFALEDLGERGEESAARQAHAGYFLELAERAGAHIYGPEMRRMLDLLEVEYLNCRPALAFFADSGDAAKELRLATMMAEFWFHRGHIPEGITLVTRAVDHGVDAMPGHRSSAMANLTLLCWAVGDNERALEVSAASIPLARETGNVHHIAEALYVRATAVRQDQRRLDEAIALLEEACLVASGYEPPLAIFACALGDLGVVWVNKGERLRGVALIEEAMALHRAAGRHLAGGRLLATLGQLDHEAGDAKLAAARFGESLRLLRDAGMPMQIGFILAALAALAIARDQSEPAARLLGMVEGIRERTGAVSMGMSGQVSHQSHQEIARSARTSLGEEAFATAVAAGRSLPLADAVADALVIADAIASNSLPPSVGVSQTTSMVRTSSQARHPSVNLSPREREVLSLLACRFTAPEIAEQLFVSTRTVESHVSAIYSKLGVNSRREAAAASARLGLV